MALSEYFNIIQKYFFVVIIFIFLGGVAAFLSSKYKPVTYTAATTFVVTKSSNLGAEPVADNYSSLNSTILISKAMATWFSSPQIAEQIYANAGVDSSRISLDTLTHTFKNSHLDPSTVLVFVTTRSEQQSLSLANAATATVTQEAVKQNLIGDSGYQVNVLPAKVWQDQANLTLNTIVGLIFGLFTGLGLSFVIESRKR